MHAACVSPSWQYGADAITDKIRLALGAENLLDEYPEHPERESDRHDVVLELLPVRAFGPVRLREDELQVLKEAFSVGILRSDGVNGQPIAIQEARTP